MLFLYKPSSCICDEFFFMYYTIEAVFVTWNCQCKSRVWFSVLSQRFRFRTPACTVAIVALSWWLMSSPLALWIEDIQIGEDRHGFTYHKALDYVLRPYLKLLYQKSDITYTMYDVLFRLYNAIFVYYWCI